MVIQKRILKYPTKYNILSTEKYGFRIGLKTDNAIYKLTSETLNTTNNTLLAGGIFCDLEKAFDCVDHDILLYRVSQEERAKLREGVPYVKLYRYNPKHLCPKLNGY